MKDNNGNYINTWTKNVYTLIKNLGLQYIWDMRDSVDIDINVIARRLHDTYIQKWSSELESFSKLQTYNMFKNELCLEKYLLCVKNEKHRVALSRLRCSAHKLAIEEGRYRNIERCDRICTLCNTHQIETEYHFILICPFYSDIRARFIKRYFRTWPNTNKFKSLMSSNIKGTICNLASFIYYATKAREMHILNVQIT